MKTMKSFITEDILEHLRYYFDQVYTHQLNLQIDGVKAFNPKSQFVEGKVVNAFSYVYDMATMDKTDSVLQKQLKEIIDLMSSREFETWGMLNCIIALNRLHEKNKLHEVVSDEALERFKEKLDWRKFVNTEDLTLIDKPTNYYGVAFGVARYRELLGFEEEGWSKKLLEKLLNHVQSFSGEFSFMDETDGQGRFDRYSTLIPAETCALLSNTGLEIPEMLLKMLRKSCDIYINLANEKGHGFSYGRSIGAYGDTAAMEVLSIAAKLNVLTEEEKEIAYAYNTLTIKKFIDFWIDNEMKSINMWEKGRWTDDYRNKNRILGENLSLSMQLINSLENWKEAGFEDKELATDYKEKLLALSSCTKIQFAEGNYSRAMYIIRDGSHVIALPLVNGANKYYCQTPYLPIPNEQGVFESKANTIYPNLVPKITFKDGVEAMPIVYIKEIEDRDVKDNLIGHEIAYTIESLCVLGEESPRKLEGVSAKVTYLFQKGKITCHIQFDFDTVAPSEVEKVTMEFASFSTGISNIGNKVTFSEGIVKDIAASGFESCTVTEALQQPNYSTPNGPLNSCATWIQKGHSATVDWTVTYN